MADFRQVHTQKKGWRGEQRRCETCGVTIMPGQRYHWTQEWFMGPKLCYCDAHRPADPVPEPEPDHRQWWNEHMRQIRKPEKPLWGNPAFIVCPFGPIIGQCVRGNTWRSIHKPFETFEIECSPCAAGRKMFDDRMREIIGDDPDVHDFAGFAERSQESEQ